MKKLFTLAFAVLASLTMWAASEVITWRPTSADVTELVKTNPGVAVTVGTGKKSFKVYSLRPFINNNSVKIEWNSTENAIKTTDNAIDKAGLVVYIPAGSNTVEKIEVFMHQTNSRKTYYGGPFVDTNPTATATATSSTIAKSSTAYEFWDTYTANTYYTFGGKKDGSGDLYYDSIKVTFDQGCADPEATIIENTAGFVGDEIDLEWSSNNTNSVTWDIKKGEAATEDASITDGKFTATKTGTYVVTATQTADATYCAVEESVTLTISAKTPVTSFEVSGPTSAHIGQEVTLTASNFDAVATEIVWRDENSQDLEFGDTYTFTPDAVGTYQFFVSASNSFNDDPVVVNHNVTVAISTDATLSDLKVNGTTVDGFAPATFSYNLGEIGVYEKPALTYTISDEGYATAVIKQDILTDGADSVVVTAEDGTTINNYIITYTRAAATPLASINGSTTWDWADAGSETAQWSGSTYPTNGTEFNFADVLINPAESFNAAALAGIAQYAKRGGSYNCFQGTKVKFNTTVAGIVEIFYQNTSNRTEDGRRWVVVNGTKVGDGAVDQKAWYSVKTNVAADDAVITFIDKSDAATMLRINKIVFAQQTYKVKWSLGENPEENLSELEDRAVTDTLYADLQKDVLTAGTYVVKVFVDDATTPIASTNLEISEVAKYDMEFKYQVSTNVLTATATKNGKTTALDNTEDNAKAIKTIENGQIVIIKNGVRYNVLGAELR